MPATRKPLTTTTWADLEGYGLSKANAPCGWEVQSDLAHEAHELTREGCSLTSEDWNVLVSAAASGLPAVIEHVMDGVPHELRRERTTRTYIIESVRPELGTWGALRAHSWGFTVNLALTQLVRVTVPKATYEYESVEA